MSNDMKLIMEGWRSYLNEEPKPEPKLIDKCQTVGDIKAIIDAMQAEEEGDENAAKLTGWAKRLGKALLGLTGVGAVALGAMDVWDTLKQLKTDLKDSPITYNTAKDYPILSHLKLDDELAKFIEDDILEKIDEMYEEEVLKNIDEDRCFSTVETISDFTRRKVGAAADMCKV